MKTSISCSRDHFGRGETSTNGEGPEFGMSKGCHPRRNTRPPGNMEIGLGISSAGLWTRAEIDCSKPWDGALVYELEDSRKEFRQKIYDRNFSTMNSQTLGSHLSRLLRCEGI
jgi:hypothetical protein